MRATKKRSLTTARTGASPSPARPGSVVLFTDAEPVLVPLGDVGERGEIAHAVEVDLPVQVIGLVLEHATDHLNGKVYLDRMRDLSTLAQDRKSTRLNSTHDQ